MSKYRVENIFCNLGLFLDEEYECEDEIECKETIMCEIMDNIGNYVDIELEEIEEEFENE
jgi:hypothetical protein